MNPFSRFVYWNMNYHVEHHMFPMVPYHALPRLHALIKDDLPAPNPSMWHAYREVWPVVLRELRYEDFYLRGAADGGAAVPRGVPRPDAGRGRIVRGERMADWIDACAVDDVEEEDVVRFDHGGRTFAIYRSPKTSFSPPRGSHP